MRAVVITAVLIVGSFLSSRASGPSFQPRVDYPAGPGPYSLCPADFDGDGKPDLAVADVNASFVSILINRGNGTFATGVSCEIGSSPASIVSADFDQDGRLDLAVVSDSTVSILKNNGGATFASPVHFAAGATPWYVVTADLDGDRKPDLVVVDQGELRQSGSVVVFRNNARNGSLAYPSTYGVGINPSSAVAADLDGDGWPDLAVVNWVGSTVSILRNNRNGTFGEPVNFNARGLYGHPYAITAADFDGDGHQDLAVAEDGSSVSIYKNIGDGTFATGVQYLAGVMPQAIIAADFDGDGRPDLATANYNAASISVLENNGDGTFAGYVSFGVGNWPYAIAAADFNGDWKIDLAVANSYDGTVSILINSAPSCCHGTAGNVDGSGVIDLADLSALVSYLTGGGIVLLCHAAANVNGAGIVDLADLSALVDYLTGGSHILPDCPQ
jgi:hypothetical protein